MDPRFDYLGFAANPLLDTSMNLGNSFPVGGAGAEGGDCADTTLRLDSVGSLMPLVPATKEIKHNWSLIRGYVDQQFDSSLCLSLGHSSSPSETKWSSGIVCTSISPAKETDDSSMDLEIDFGLYLANDKTPRPKSSTSSEPKILDEWPAIDLELSLSSCAAESDVTTLHLTSTSPQSVIPHGFGGSFQTDEVSTVSHWKTASIFHLLHAPQDKGSSYFSKKETKEVEPFPVSPHPSSSVITNPNSSVTCTSGSTKQQQRSSGIKQCQFKGCVKGARGASGFCIAHGGGRRCQKPDCHKGAEGRTAFCKAHGGGRRCEFLGCTKSAEGRTDCCIAHGGGRRCSHEGCTHAARGKSGLCIRHGGGRRCQVENCTKSAEGGLSGLCISHGGGRRCQYPQCLKGAQGSTMLCKAHGGGKRCTFEGCNKGAEGSTPFCKGHGGGKRCSFQGGGICPKSVHGGTLFCVAHGGGKRCAIPECSKSARGRTDYCVRHGGGKRCKFEDCGKSAQGRTDFCKAHGRGKRCSWGQPGSEFGQNDSPCNSFPRGKTGLGESHGALEQDKCVHGSGTLGSAILDSTPQNPGKMKEIVNAEDLYINIMKMGSNVLTSTGWKYFGFNQASMPVGGSSSSVSEGRVHGGSLMAMLACGSRHTLHSSTGTVTTSEPSKPFATPKNWT